MGLRTRTLQTGVGLKSRLKLVLKVALLLLFAYFVGRQIYSPHPRVIKLVIALLLFWMTIRSPLPKVVAVLAFIIPFSAGTAIGDTSGLAIVLVFLVWMVRVAAGGTKPVWETPVSVSIVALVLIHALSFFNTPAGYQMQFALKKMLIVLASILFMYLILNFVNDERSLRRIVLASMLSCAVIVTLSVIELYYPTLRLIPWFTRSGARDYGSVFGHRTIGGPFRDGELLGEYVAVYAPLQVFMLARARSMPMKAFWTLMIIGSFFTAIATMHRAPLISMCIGFAYLLFLFRKRFKLHTLMALLLLGCIFVPAVEFVMAEYTPTGSIKSRIEKTKFYGGIPDSRRAPWKEAWERSFEHPWIGHGPYYDIGYPVAIYYTPHSTYLHYFYTIGVIGVAIFLWFMVNLIRMTVRYMSARTGIVSFSTDLLVVIHVQILVFLVDAIKINYQRNNTYYLLLWMVFGIGLASYRVAQRSTAEEIERRRNEEVPKSGTPGLLTEGIHRPGRPSPRSLSF